MVSVLQQIWSNLADLWEQTLGDPDVCVAVLDGPVETRHPCFDGANLTTLKSSGEPLFWDHGTHIASILFAQHTGAVKGIAPKCRGLLMPIFGIEGAEASCSQLDLAHALGQALADHYRVLFEEVTLWLLRFLIREHWLA